MNSTMFNREYIYIAGDWTGDKDAIEKLYKWNADSRFPLSFPNVHDTTQSSDDSLLCSIKQSLKKRMDKSYAFVLIVGKQTSKLTKGGCQNCISYNSWTKSCVHSSSIDYRSYVEYECEEAVKANIDIVVLYKSNIVDKSLCPEILQNIGQHVAMCHNINGILYWDVDRIINVFENLKPQGDLFYLYSKY